jgi:uncharacterized membrane protein YphA (DoxX/SURF4 family)
MNLTTKTEHFVVRVFAFYLIFVLLFILPVGFSYPEINFITEFLSFIPRGLVNLVNKFFIHHLQGIPDYWGLWDFITSIIFLFIAILIALIWNFLRKQKSDDNWLKYFYIIARYHLAFVLFMYGFDKMDWVQFTPSPEPTTMMQPVGNLTPYFYFWTFMSVSKSYQFFGGLIETIAGIMLLFRRTTTAGSMMAIPVLLNVLMLNIGYDVPVKFGVFILILFAIFILLPDIKNLIRFIFLKQPVSLYRMQPAIANKKYRWIQYITKLVVITYFLINLIKGEAPVVREMSVKIGPVAGIHNVKEFYSSSPLFSLPGADSIRWKKLAINNFWMAGVQFENDSILIFNKSKVDTALHLLNISLWKDTAFKGSLNYKRVGPENWLFEGMINKDSVHFITQKKDIDNSKLIRDQGKMKWYWYKYE